MFGDDCYPINVEDLSIQPSPIILLSNSLIVNTKGGITENLVAPINLDRLCFVVDKIIRIPNWLN